MAQTNGASFVPYPVGHRCCDNCQPDIDWYPKEHCCHATGCECEHGNPFRKEGFHSSKELGCIQCGANLEQLGRVFPSTEGSDEYRAGLTQGRAGAIRLQAVRLKLAEIVGMLGDEELDYAREAVEDLLNDIDKSFAAGAR